MRTAIVLLLLAVAAPLGAQKPAPIVVPVEELGDEPMRCWWRTSTGAVRVGEIFSVVLTCAVVETAAVTVMPNREDLDPSAVQLQPFEVVEGVRRTDLQTEDRRFFQYEYRTRLINQDQFGQEVAFPELKILYKVRTQVDGNALEGRDLTYQLPPISVRLLSLVPTTATDIRDATSGTFEELERERSLARILRLSGGILFALAAIPAFFALVSLVNLRQGKSTTKRALVSDGAILRQVGRELSSIGRARRDGGWTPALATRLSTALRIISAYALRVPVLPVASRGRARRRAGHLTMRAGGWRRKNAVVAAWVTPALITSERVRRAAEPGFSPAEGARLQELEDVLAKVTAVQYGRDVAPDDTAFDEALAFGKRVLRRLKVENIWIVKKGLSLGQSKAILEDGVWVR
jgi:hypothetical protein